MLGVIMHTNVYVYTPGCCRRKAEIEGDDESTHFE
jgi:hypothetical protein